MSAASSSAHVSEQVREAGAWVAERADSVRIVADRLADYATGLARATGPEPDPEVELLEGSREERIAFVVCLDAINFGSGWWPTIEKREGRSGYMTMAMGVTERFRAHGPWTTRELRAMDAAGIAATLGQVPDHPLMAQYAASLRDVGGHVEEEHGGSFAALVDSAGGSALALIDILAGWAAFADRSIYDGREVPFFKRAQIAAADLDRLGLARFADVDRISAFADNLVPHVLRLDGILEPASELTARIERGELLEHGSPEEVELRACTVHAIELLVAARREAGLEPLAAAEIDFALWNRGQEPRYKAIPRPRSRTTAY